MSTPQYKKKIKPGLIELDPEQPTLIVHLTTQILDLTNTDASGRPTVVETQQEQRRFKLKSFTVNSNIPKFAAALISKCELIHESKTPWVEGLLQQLAQRMKQQQEEQQQQEEAPPLNLNNEDEDELNMSVSVGSTFKLNSTGPVNLNRAGLKSPPTVASSRSTLSTTAPVPLHPSKSPSSFDQEEEKERDTSNPSSPRSPAVIPTSRQKPRTADTLQPRERVDVAGPRSSSARARDPTDPDHLLETNSANSLTSSKKNNDRTKSKERSVSAEEDRDERRSKKRKDKGTERDRDRDRDTDDRSFNGPSSPSSSSSSSLFRSFKDNPDPKTLDKQRTQKMRQLLSSRLLLPQPSSSSSSSTNNNNASLSEMDTYIEDLYDESIHTKIEATGKILSLIRTPASLSYCVNEEHRNVLEILARVLSEERKKNMDLILNIMEIFWILSRYTQLHPLILSNKIGDVTMKIIALELKRYDIRIQECGGGSSGTGGGIGESSDDRLALVTNKKIKLDKASLKYFVAQNKLLYLCFTLLLHLSEDVMIEMKMKERDLIDLLMKTLVRNITLWNDRTYRRNDQGEYYELLNVLLFFHKKLSIFAENKQEMEKWNLIDILFNIWNHNDIDKKRVDTLELTMRLLYNLSFDTVLRGKIITHGQQFLPICIQHSLQRKEDSMTGTGSQADVGIRLLYSLSMDRETRDRVMEYCASLFLELIDMAINYPYKWIHAELMALLINLTASSTDTTTSNSNDSHSGRSRKSSTTAVPSDDQLHALIKRVQQTLDPLLFKFLFHLTVAYPSVSLCYTRYIPELIGLTVKCAQMPDSLYHLFAILNQIHHVQQSTTTPITTTSNNNYTELLLQYNYFIFLSTQLTVCEDDIKLEILGLLPMICTHNTIAKKIADTKIMTLLFQFLHQYQDDADMMVQLLYVIYVLLLYENSRFLLIEKYNGLLQLLLEFILDPCFQIRKVANICLCILMECNEGWREQISRERFEQFNRKWILKMGIDAKKLTALNNNNNNNNTSSSSSSSTSTSTGPNANQQHKTTVKGHGAGAKSPSSNRSVQSNKSQYSSDDENEEEDRYHSNEEKEPDSPVDRRGARKVVQQKPSSSSSNYRPKAATRGRNSHRSRSQSRSPSRSDSDSR